MIIMKKIYFTLIALLASINMLAQEAGLLTIVASCCKDSHGILTTTPNGLF